MQLEFDGQKPVHLHLIQISHRDAANLRPRAVDEGVVVQKLASQNKGDSQETEQVIFSLGDASQHRHP